MALARMMERNSSLHTLELDRNGACLLACLRQSINSKSVRLSVTAQRKLARNKQAFEERQRLRAKAAAEASEARRQAEVHLQELAAIEKLTSISADFGALPDAAAARSVLEAVLPVLNGAREVQDALAALRFRAAVLYRSDQFISGDDVVAEATARFSALEIAQQPAAAIAALQTHTEWTQTMLACVKQQREVLRVATEAVRAPSLLPTVPAPALAVVPAFAPLDGLPRYLAALQRVVALQEQLREAVSTATTEGAALREQVARMNTEAQQRISSLAARNAGTDWEALETQLRVQGAMTATAASDAHAAAQRAAEAEPLRVYAVRSASWRTRRNPMRTMRLPRWKSCARR